MVLTLKSGFKFWCENTVSLPTYGRKPLEASRTISRRICTISFASLRPFQTLQGYSIENEIIKKTGWFQRLGWIPSQGIEQSHAERQDYQLQTIRALSKIIVASGYTKTKDVIVSIMARLFVFEERKIVYYEDYVVIMVTGKFLLSTRQSWFFSTEST